jgi:hypothetical protein
MKFFICVSLVIYVWIFECRADVVKLDLKKTIQYAVAHSPSLEATRREMSITDMNRKNAYSVFLPQLDIGSTHGIRDRDPSLGAGLSSHRNSLR